MLLWIGTAAVVFIVLWLLKAYLGLIFKLFANPIGLILIVVAAIWWYNTGTPTVPNQTSVATVANATAAASSMSVGDVLSEVFWFIVMLPITIATFILNCIAWVLNGIAWLIT